MSSWQQALRNWLRLTLVFLVFGGIGAGVTNLLFEWIVGRSFDPILYAVIFGVTGWIACRQLEALFS